MRKHVGIFLGIAGGVSALVFLYLWSLRGFKIDYIPYGKSGYELYEGLLFIISLFVMAYGWVEYFIHRSSNQRKNDGTDKI